MPSPLRPFRRQQQLEDEAKIRKIVGEAEPPDATGAAGGDSRRLRGIPAVARGTGGTVFGTDPVRALLAKHR
jgi:hypothetical protein